MKIYSDRTNSKIFGFFIEGSNGLTYLKHTVRDFYVDEKGNDYTYETAMRKQIPHWDLDSKLKELAQKFKKEKLLVSHKEGYNKFFMILGGKDLEIDDQEFTFDGKVTSNRLAREFMKFNQKRQINRVLVNKFIEGIASQSVVFMQQTG